MAIKNIIFDFGGVLVDWNPEYFYETVFDDKSELHYFLNEVCTLDWNLEQDRGRTFEEGIKELQKEHPKYKEEIAMYLEGFDVMLREEISANTELIEPLKEHNHVYGLTNCSAETITIIEDKFSFPHKLEGMVVSGREKTVKPHSRIYEILLERYNLNAEDCLFVDDRKKNIEGARKAGLKGIHFSNGTNLKKEFQKWDVL